MGVFLKKERHFRSINDTRLNDLKKYYPIFFDVCLHILHILLSTFHGGEEYGRTKDIYSGNTKKRS